MRSRSLDCLARREVGPACAQRAAILISGGYFCFAQPPAIGKSSTAGGDWLSFQFAGRRKSIRNKTQQVGTACYETFQNALARMTYCLGHPAITAAPNGPVGNRYPFCKSMQKSV